MSRESFDRLHVGDCVEGMAGLPEGSVDLAFADPPYNIGYRYDTYDDKRDWREYVDWCRTWIEEVVRVLKPGGTFWLAIGDEHAADLKYLCTRQLDPPLTCRSWVIWYYTFGVNCKAKFSRSHAHLFHFVKEGGEYTFNADDPAVRVPSARQLVYADKRANPRGRLPDDTWIMLPGPDEERLERWLLRPQDAPDGFDPGGDVWYFPRVNGTFDERAGWHGCQMPEQLLGRIVRVSSHEGDVVLDPFAGSGTTLAVAKKLHRRWLGFELSADYAKYATERIAEAAVGDELHGPADPVRSAPTTAKGRRLK
ncbi:MAG: DNA methyltransferase, partial [Planctomycetota bacterium]